MKVVVSGVPRGYQEPHPDGNWLQEKHRNQIEAISLEIELLEMSQKEVNSASAKVNDIEVILAEGGNRTHYGEELDWEDYLKFFTSSLKWVQLCSTGFSDNITPEIMRGEVILTNAPGIHTIPIAESVMAAMLDFAKRLKHRRIDQTYHLWKQRMCRELYKATVLIFGLGNIGKRVAQLCKVFDMRVIGTKRQVEPVDNVDLVFSPNKIRCYIPQADFIVIAAPLTPLIEKVIGINEFSLMNTNSYLINVGRGGIIDEVAMIETLKEGRIGGAYLDCHVEEPLPKDHPLWDIDNVLVVPHDSHSSPFIGDRIVDIFCNNLEKYVRGDQLLHVCDPSRGY